MRRPPGLGLFNVWQSREGIKRGVCVSLLKSNSEMCLFMARCTQERISRVCKRFRIGKKFRAIPIYLLTLAIPLGLNMQKNEVNGRLDSSKTVSLKNRTSTQSRVHVTSLLSREGGTECQSAVQRRCPCTIAFLPQLT